MLVPKQLKQLKFNTTSTSLKLYRYKLHIKGQKHVRKEM